LNQEQAIEMLGRARMFVMEVHRVVGEETKAWAAEFQAAIRELDRTAKTAIEANQPAAINVHVTNGTECPEGWSIGIDGGPLRPHTGHSATFPALPAGQHTVRARASWNGMQKSAEKTIALPAGGIVDVDLTLA
jgi:hypothetical protein